MKRGCKKWPSPHERLWAKTEPEPNSGCWIWIGVVNNMGYGHFRVGEREVLVHRYSYENAKGPIPAGLEIDHRCFQPRCVNPDHLAAVDHFENMRRYATLKLVKSPTCPAGHLYDGLQTTYRGRTTRRCRSCRKITALAWWRRDNARA